MKNILSPSQRRGMENHMPIKISIPPALPQAVTPIFQDGVSSVEIIIQQRYLQWLDFLKN